MKKLHKTFLVLAVTLLGAQLSNAQYVGEPFSGSAIQVGGTLNAVTNVEFENYDSTSGTAEGVNSNDTNTIPPTTGTYSDTTVGNAGDSSHRSGSDVDMSAGGTGIVVNNTANSDYMIYTIEVVEAGPYTIKVNYGHGAAGTKGFQLFLRNANTLSNVVTLINEGLPATGGSTTYADFSVTDVDLTAGTYALHARFTASGPNYDYMSFERTGVAANDDYVGLPFSGTAITLGTTEDVATTVEFEDFDKTAANTNGVNTSDSSTTPVKTGTYNDSTAGNAQDSDHRSGSDVDIKIGGSGHYVRDVTNGEYLLYTVDVAVAGPYTVVVNYAHGAAAGKAFQLFLRNATTLAEVETIIDESLPVTGSSTTFADFSKSSVNLTAGTYVLHARFPQSGPSWDYMTFTRNGVAGIEDASANSVAKVYPNPSATGIFTLENAASWEIISLVGVKVLEGNGATIDASGLAKGSYILKSGNGTQVIVIN